MGTLEAIKHFFIPRHTNNYRAKGLHIDTLTIFLLVAVGLSFLLQFSKTHILGIATDVTVGKLLEETNSIRYKNGLPPLQYNQKLSDAAASKASDMLTCGYWAHMRPSSCPGGSATPWDFISKAGYKYEVAGENLAHGFPFSKDVVKAWENSPTHLANLVRPEYDEVGFAIMNGTLDGEETTLIVQMFGKQLAQNTQPDSNNLPIDEIAQEESPQEKPDTTEPEQKIIVAGATNNQELPPSLQTGSFISMQQLSLNSSFFILGIILLVLSLDLYFAYRFHIIRINGKNMAHIAFVVLIILGILILKNGAII